MSIDWGFDFRGTDAFVTDPTNCVSALGTDTYPTTKGGRTFGWNSSTSSIDRDSGVDARLAGINYVSPGGQQTWQLDFTSDAYDIRLANGDTGGSQGQQYVEILDDTTSLFTLNDVSVSQDTYFDATDVNRSEADWPSLNAANSQTFATTTLKLKLGSGLTLGFSVLAHLHITTASAAGPIFSQLERGIRGLNRGLVI